jgi:hypothetical protein
LVPILGPSRPESVANHSARFASLIASEATARRDLTALELSLGLENELLNRPDPNFLTNDLDVLV